MNPSPIAPPRRGEVWLVGFNPVPAVIGREQAGPRPALVLSIDGFNAGPADLVTVLPITRTNLQIPSRVPVAPPEGGLPAQSYIIAEQTHTVSRGRLVRRMGLVQPATMGRVETVVRLLLGL